MSCYKTITHLSEQIESINVLPYGGSKEWLVANGNKDQLYQIDGYVWGYVESNGWTRSNRQFRIVSSESAMTNQSGTPYLLRKNNTGTVYAFEEASGDINVPVYDKLPETANNGDIVAVKETVVTSISQMTDTSKKYILESTGTVWEYTTRTVEVEPENLYDPNAITLGKRHSGTPGTITDGSTYFMTDYIPVDITQTNPSLNIYGDIRDYNDDGRPNFQKIAWYNASKECIGSKYIACNSHSSSTAYGVYIDGGVNVRLDIDGTGATFSFKDEIAFVRIEVIPTGNTAVASDASAITSIVDPTIRTAEVSEWVNTNKTGNRKYKAHYSTSTVYDCTNLYNPETMATDEYLNMRVNSSAGYSESAGLFSTPFISIPQQEAGAVFTLRTKNVPVQNQSGGYARILLYQDSSQSTDTPSGNIIYAEFTITEEDDGVVAYSKTISDANNNLRVTFYMSDNSLTADDVKDVIITVNEEIVSREVSELTWTELGTYIEPTDAGWNATTETHKIIDSITTTSTSGDTAVYSGDGYSYTYIIGAGWMELSASDSSSMRIDTELSFTSKNAIQNKAVTYKIDELDTMLQNHQNSIVELSEKVTNISLGGSTNTGSTELSVPTFWQDAVDECITKIKALQLGRRCVTFPFFSDNHQRNGYAGLLIAYIMQECHIPYAFFGGDSISSGYIADEATMIEQDRLFDLSVAYIPKGRFCRAVGNHDGYWAVDASNKNYYTDAQIYELFLREESTSQTKHFGGDGTYYYVDDVASKTRFVVLDTNDSTVEQEQLDWLQNVALKFNENGWGVVFISHQPISNHYHAGISNCVAVRTIVQNHMASTNENKADIIGWYSGHIHRDRIYSGIAVNTSDDSEGTDMGFKQVTITSDHTSIAYDDATKHTVANDDLSHAIDFVTVNRATRTVNITRLGIGNDRSYTY